MKKWRLKEIGTDLPNTWNKTENHILESFFSNLSKNNETGLYKENRQHKEPLAKAARALRE